MVAPVRLAVALSLGLGLIVAPRVAQADDDGHRFGLVGLVGGGVASLVHPGALSGSVGFTDIGAEILGEVRPWGGFVRGEFLSSGSGTRWTAFAFSAGTEYRLFGDVRHTAFFLRGGLAYERWLGNNAGCPIDLFVPDSCNLNGVMTGNFNVSTDMLGVIAGARLEAPISSAYLAASGNFVPVAAVDSSNPTAAFELRFTLELGFRDRKTPSSEGAPSAPRVRKRTESSTPFGE